MMSYRKSLLRKFAAAAIAAATLCAIGVAAPHGASAEGRLSANQFLALEPFVIPMMPDGEVRRQFTLVVALELKDEDERDRLKVLMPLIRSRSYDLLFRLIAYRTQEPLVPSTGLLKKKMLEIASGVAGPDVISSIVVQQVYQGPAP